MTALAASRVLEYKMPTRPEGDVVEVPVAAATTIYSGGFVGMLATGYAQPYVNSTVATSLTGFDRLLGVALEEVDNSAGAAGALTVKVLISGCFKHAVSGLAITDIGTPVYASDDNTLTKVALGNCFAGWVERFVASGYGMIRLPGANSGGVSPRFERLTPSIETVAANLALLIHPTENQNGLLIMDAFAMITEVMAGGTEDQGIITLEDTDGTDICTFTPTDAGADAANDIVVASAGARTVCTSTGDLLGVVAAGKGVQALVSQLTSGTSEAGAMKVFCAALPCA